MAGDERSNAQEKVDAAAADHVVHEAAQGPAAQGAVVPAPAATTAAAPVPVAPVAPGPVMPGPVAPSTAAAVAATSTSPAPAGEPGGRRWKGGNKIADGPASASIEEEPGSEGEVLELGGHVLPVNSPLDLKHERLVGVVVKYAPANGWGVLKSHMFEGELGFKLERIMPEFQGHPLNEGEAVEFDVQPDDNGRAQATAIKPVLGRKPTDCLGQRHRGYVRRFAERWGFLNAAAFDGDLFVHRDNLLPALDQLGDGQPLLRSGQAVEFDVALDDRGRCVAKQITTRTLLRPCDWIGHRLRGYIRSFQGAWGFINSDRFAGDLFVHRDSLLAHCQSAQLSMGTGVEFDIERDHHRKGTKNRLVARNVAVLGPGDSGGATLAPGTVMPLPPAHSSVPMQAMDPAAAAAAAYGGLPLQQHMPPYGVMNPQAAAFVPGQGPMYYPHDPNLGAPPPVNYGAPAYPYAPPYGVPLPPPPPLVYGQPAYPPQPLPPPYQLPYGPQPPYGLPPQPHPGHMAPLPPPLPGPAPPMPQAYMPQGVVPGSPEAQALAAQAAHAAWAEAAAAAAQQQQQHLPPQPLPMQQLPLHPHMQPHPQQPLPPQPQHHLQQPPPPQVQVQMQPQPQLQAPPQQQQPQQPPPPQPLGMAPPVAPPQVADGTAATATAPAATTTSAASGPAGAVPLADGQSVGLLHITMHDWEPDQPGQLWVTKGTLVNVSYKAAHGWVYASTLQPGGATGEPVSEGWVPQAVVKRISLCRVTADWVSEGPGTLGVVGGEIIAISKEADRGWVYGEKIGPRQPDRPSEGWLPKKMLDYLQS